MTLQQPLKPGEYKTRDGRKALVLATGAPGRFPLMGYVIESYGEARPVSWTAAGAFRWAAPYADEDDLVAEWREPKTTNRTVWLWLYEDGTASIYFYPPPDSYRTHKFLKVVGARKVTATVTEGEFDDN